MPTDLAARDARLIHVKDRAGTDLPFSKGLMATSILATGLETDRAYAIAAEIQQQLVQRRRPEIDADDLAALAAATIAARADEQVADRYRAWRRVKRTGRSVLLILGGAPGVGKSTIATRLAVRMGITRIVTTDTIREVLRTVIPSTVLPELHVSTYETAPPLPGNPPLGTFHRQARAVCAATAAVASRLASERRSAIVEGVHVLPGEISAQLRQHPAAPIVVELLLTLDDEDLHHAHLAHRRHGEPARAGQRHLDRFGEIRQLQATLRELARAAGVREFDVASPQGLTQLIVDRVLAGIDGRGARTSAA